MEARNKVIDLTLSDNDDSDEEMLSLHERILRMEKNKLSKDSKKTVPCVPKSRSVVGNEKTDLCKKEDSDSEEELPSLGTLLGLQKDKKLLFSDDEDEIAVLPVTHIKQFSPKLATVVNIDYEEQPCLSHHVSEKYKEITLPHIADELYSLKLPETNFVQENGYSLDSEEELSGPVLATKRAKKTKPKQDVNNSKELAKQERLKLKEEKKQEKELAKALKASEKELQKSKKPDECLKGMKVILDQGLIQENESEDIFFALDGANLQYNIEDNPVPLSVNWCRTVLDVTVENNQVVKQEREELENILVLVINNENFIKMVHSSTQKLKGKSDSTTSLVEHICNIKSMFPVMDVTCVIIGLDKYQRSVKENDLCSSEMKKLSKQASKAAIEEATAEVQIQAYVNFNFLSNMKEFGEMLSRFSKAIAEAPQRREKHAQKSLAFSWYADADNNCPVKLGKDGDGSIKLWQQQIRQFNNVGEEVAEAIVSQYPTLQSLIQAYNHCISTQQAEKLLQDIVVRRNYGPLGTQRRIGPELSYKIYLFYSSRDGDQVLQR